MNFLLSMFYNIIRFCQQTSCEGKRNKFNMLTIFYVFVGVSYLVLTTERGLVLMFIEKIKVDEYKTLLDF